MLTNRKNRIIIVKSVIKVFPFISLVVKNPLENKMVYYTRENCIHSIKPLYRIANVLALVPPYEDLEKNKVIIYRCYSTIIILTLIVSFVFSMSGKIAQLYVNNNYNCPTRSTVIVIDVTLHSTMTISVIVAIFRGSFCNIKRFHLLTETFDKIDERMREIKYNYESEKSRKFYIEMYAVHIIAGFFYICNACIWINAVGFGIYCKFLQREIASYYNVIIMMLVYNYSIAIKQRFCVFNNFLSQLIQSPSNSDLIVESTLQNKESNVAIMQRTRKMFSILSELVNIVNRLFGWHIFFLYATTFVGFLEVINLIIQILLIKEFFQDGGIGIGPSVVVLSLAWFVGLMVCNNVFYNLKQNSKVSVCLSRSRYHSFIIYSQKSFLGCCLN